MDETQWIMCPVCGSTITGDKTNGYKAVLN